MYGNLGNKIGSGTSDNDVVIEFTDIVDGADVFYLQSTAGAMDVVVSLDGTNYSTAPLNMFDGGAITNDPVIVTVANRTYAFRGLFKGIRVLQNGGTAVENAVLRYGRLS